MPTVPARRVLAAALLWLLFFTAVQAADKADKRSQPKLTPEQRSKVNKLLSEYRAAGTKVDKKEAVCDKVLEIGPAAVPLMLAAVDRDMQPKLKKYETKFQTQAASAAKKKVSKVDLNEVMQMRKSVLDLQKLGDGFTHEVIATKIDPIIVKLRAAFILDRSEVLEKSADLQAEGKKLSDFGRLWEKCRAQMPAGSADRDKSAPPTFDGYLQDEENLAASMAVPLDPKTRAVLAMNAKLAAKIDPEEARAVLELNLTRNLLGLPALVIDLNLCAVRETTPPTWKSWASSPTSRPWKARKRLGTGRSASGRRPAPRTSTRDRPAARPLTTVGSTVRGTIAIRWAITREWESAAAVRSSRKCSAIEGGPAWPKGILRCVPARAHGSGG